MNPAKRPVLSLSSGHKLIETLPDGSTRLVATFAYDSDPIALALVDASLVTLTRVDVEELLQSAEHELEMPMGPDSDELTEALETTIARVYAALES